MSTRSRFFFIGLCALLTAAAGCAESGSDPTLFPEVRFQVIPSGQATFQVLSLVAGGVSHPSVVGPEFAISAPLSFVLENAPAPYQGTFVQTGSGTFRVRLTVEGQTEQDSDATAGVGTMVTVTLGGPINPASTPAAANPEVRFDVCTPLPNMSSCSTTDGSGSVAITGTLGDAFISHLLQLPCPQGGNPCDATPGIYFLDGARQMANAVFRSVGGQKLVVQLFVNGQLKQTSSGTDDVIITEDL